MKIWLLKWNETKTRYDAYYGFVVRAESEAAARQFIFDDQKDDRWAVPSAEVWLGPEVSCDEITNDGPAEIILSDFNAG